MGYREHSFVITTNFVHDSGHADANTINLANEADGSGFGNIVLPGTAGTDLIVTVTADGAELMLVQELLLQLQLTLLVAM
mgnify:CR=1 FL=1